MADLRSALRISTQRLEEINALLTHPDNPTVSELLQVVERYGGPQENQPQGGRGRTSTVSWPGWSKRSPLRQRPEVADRAARQKGLHLHGGIRQEVFGAPAALNQKNAVTLEIKRLAVFPWLITEARHCIQQASSCRADSSGAQDGGAGDRQRDIMAVAAAMQIMAPATWKLWTPGHRRVQHPPGGPRHHRLLRRHRPTQPLPHQVGRRVPEYYTTYGVRQVLNITPGTVLWDI